MIYNYPYFGFPNYSNYNRKNNPVSNINSQYNVKSFNCPNNPSLIDNNRSNNYFNVKETPKHSPIKENKKDDSPFLNIFGISLYFDDILLICLIFF